MSLLDFGRGSSPTPPEGQSLHKKMAQVLAESTRPAASLTPALCLWFCCGWAILAHVAPRTVRSM